MNEDIKKALELLIKRADLLAYQETFSEQVDKMLAENAQATAFLESALTAPTNEEIKDALDALNAAVEVEHSREDSLDFGILFDNYIESVRSVLLRCRPDRTLEIVKKHRGRVNRSFEISVENASKQVFFNPNLQLKIDLLTQALDDYDSIIREAEEGKK